MAGSLGAVSRYAVDAWANDHLGGPFPWGTLIVNLSGSFAFGLVFTLVTERLDPHPDVRFALTTGFLGAYTTFSTFAFETYRLADRGNVALAIVNVIGSIGAALMAVWLGIRLARA
ncbi:MAG TPA: fluoride efflux transporter CrcB [Dehalococcoidia bacterium]|nr:fluoride efflux transporter CrcB [Dehalococcoidia bacterium]